MVNKKNAFLGALLLVVGGSAFGNYAIKPHYDAKVAEKEAAEEKVLEIKTKENRSLERFVLSSDQDCDGEVNRGEFIDLYNKVKGVNLENSLGTDFLYDAYTFYEFSIEIKEGVDRIVIQHSLSEKMDSLGWKRPLHTYNVSMSPETADGLSNSVTPVCRKVLSKK